VGRTVLESDKEGKVFLDGRGVKNACLNILSGHIYITDLECINLNVLEFADDLIPQSLDLSNVVIRGSDFGPLNLQSSRWQNVTIYPPVNMEEVNIKNLQVYNVSFPEGSPWTEISPDNHINITQSPTPFNFPEIKVPSPESLGIIVE
jgi:hypothetical protein